MSDTQVDLLEKVHSKTNLTGSNRMELLLFKLDDSDDIFGINVFKVREVVQGSQHKITKVPRVDERVLGLISIRDVALTLLDLPYALNRSSRPCPKPESRLIIITEYSGSSQAFLIHDVNRIINKSWEEIEVPPQGLGDSSSVVGVTWNDGRIVQILDVEGLLADVSGLDLKTENIETIQSKDIPINELPPVICAEDSKVAQKALTEILTKLGIPFKIFSNGMEAWKYLENTDEKPLALISDLEMPEMDGYTLIRNVRKSKHKDIPIVVNSSMSGDFNKDHVEKAGADDFVSKWEGAELSKWLTKVINQYLADINK